MHINTQMYEAHAHRHAHFTLLHLHSSITTLFLSPSTTVLVDSFSSVTVDFAVLFVMPVMGRMSDQDTSVRLAASMCFAQLIPLAALQVILSHTPLWASAGVMPGVLGTLLMACDIRIWHAVLYNLLLEAVLYVHT